MTLTKLISVAISSAILLNTCGNEIDTGRNSAPPKWPGHSDSATPVDGRAPTTGGRDPSPSGCFELKAAEIPADIAKLCADTIKPLPQLAELYPVICQQGLLIKLLSKPTCGWNGNPATMRRFAHHFSVQTDPAKDYEDTHATVTHAPVTVHRYLVAPRLAYENFDEFRQQGFQWMAGTLGQKNLSGTTWENGIDYHFRADKGQYELGYKGTTKLFQLSPTRYASVNYATGDFARVAAYSEITLFQEQPDHTTVAVKLVHRRISSQGLYEIAKKSCAEQLKDMLEKGYKNAVKP